MTSDLDKLPFLQVLYELTTIRVYYVPSHKLFFLTVVDLSGVQPLAIKDLKTAINQLQKLIKNRKCIDFTIFYPNNTPNKYKKEINKLSGEFKEKDYNVVIKKSLILLLRLRGLLE